MNGLHGDGHFTENLTTFIQGIVGNERFWELGSILQSYNFDMEPYTLAYNSNFLSIKTNSIPELIYINNQISCHTSIVGLIPFILNWS